MASRPPSAEAVDGNGSVRMSPAEFEQALRAATVSHPSPGFGPRTALIPDLRRALAGTVNRADFDQGLRRLRNEGSIALRSHAHPEFLSPFEVQELLLDGETLLFLIRWLR